MRSSRRSWCSRARSTTRTPLADELKQRVRDNLAAYAYPRVGLLRRRLPKTPSGKIQRFVLRDQRRAELEGSSMAEVDLVLAEDADRIRTLILNRPEQLNAFDQALCGCAHRRAAARRRPTTTVRVVVVTGAGRAFSAGTDLVELAANGDFRGPPERSGRASSGSSTRSPSFPSRWSVPSTASPSASAPRCWGLADLVVLADTARLRCPFTSLSLVTRGGGERDVPVPSRPASRRVGADELGVGRRRRGQGDGPGMEGRACRGRARTRRWRWPDVRRSSAGTRSSRRSA